MCRRLVVLSIAAAEIAVAGYSFSFTCRTDTLKRIPPGGSAVFWFTLTNTGDERDAYRFDCRVLDSVPGATVVYCIGGLCAEPGIPLFDSLPAGGTDTAIDVSVYAGQNTGTEVVTLSVRSLGDSSLAASVVTRTEVSTGIAEEHSGVPPRPVSLRVAPNPVSGRGTTVSFSTRTWVRCRLALHDVTGSLVETLLDAQVGPGQHEVTWRPDGRLTPGVYLLRLTTERTTAGCRAVLE